MADLTPPPPEPDDAELLDTGQEEVFSRTEVEQGRIEHSTEAGRRPHSPEAGQDGAPASSGDGSPPA